MASLAFSSPRADRPHRRSKGGETFRRLLTHLILLAGGLIWVYPFLWMLGSSFKSPLGFFAEGLSVIPKEFLWQNYVEAWNAASFGQYFLNTVIISVGTVFFTLAIASMAGYILARKKFPGKMVVISFIVITLFLPSGYTILPIYDLIIRLGLIEQPLIAVMLVETAGGLVFPTFLLMGYFSTLDRELEEAALIDGANFHQLFWRVMLPLATPMLATVGLFTFISSWNNFFIPLVFTAADSSTSTLAVGMYSFVGNHSTNWTEMSAAAVISLVPIMLVFVFLQRYFINAIAGAIKG